MSNLVKYGSFDLEELEKIESKIEQASGKGDFLKPKNRKNILRFLPPKVGQRSPFLITHEHYVKADNGSSARFVCPKNMENKPCPACDMFAKLYSSGNRIDRDKSFEFKPKLRVYANVVTSDDPHHPKIYAFGKTVWDSLKRIRKDTDDGGDFCDPSEEGFNIVITKTGEKLNTRYSVTAARNNSALEDFSAIERQWDLSKYAVVPSLEEAMDLMQNGYQKEEREERQYQPESRQISDGSEGKPRADSLIYDVDDDDDVPW